MNAPPVLSPTARRASVLTLGSAAAVAIDSAQLFDRVRSTARWTEASRAITTALLWGELSCAEQGVVLVPSEADLPVDDVDTLVVSTAVGMHADEVLGQRVPVDGSTMG